MADKRLQQALRAVSAAVMAFAESETDYQRLLEAIVRSVSDALGDVCTIAIRSDDGTALTTMAMYDRDPQVVAACGPVIGQPMPLAPAQLAAGMSAPLFIPVLDPDRVDDRMPAPTLDVIRKVGAHSLIAIPLQLRGEVIGVLTVMRYRKDRPALDEVELEVAEQLATHAALALGNVKQANRFVDAILEHIPDMVFVKEASELRFVQFNRAGEELLGVSREQLMGKNDFDLFPEEQAEFFVAKDREALAGGKLVEIPEEPIQTAHGQRWLHTKKVPIVDDAGVPRYLLGISRDITDDKRNKAALVAANRELEAFSYSVAHDLRAPLRGIDGFAQALLEDYRDQLDAAGLRYLERIRAAAQRMAMLIDDLLHLSRVTRTELRREPVDLSRIARASLANLERAEPDREVDVAIADGMRALGDPRLLAIVFDNLLGNAWKFTSKIEHPHIEVGVKEEGGERVFFVRDNGAGFDTAYRDKLFGVFQRLHAASDYPGTGIGLATVLRIIERHGGRVWADGEVGKGATFYFTLPEAT